jgi:hypothetical protein
MSAVRLLAVFAENKPGQLARVTQLLADDRVNIHWIGIAGVEIFGVIRFLVDHTDRAFQSLQAHGLTVSLVEVLAAEVEDKPGQLHAVASALAANNISLTNCSGFVFNHRAILLLEVDEVAKARPVLLARGIHLLNEEELLHL